MVAAAEPARCDTGAVRVSWTRGAVVALAATAAMVFATTPVAGAAAPDASTTLLDEIGPGWVVDASSSSTGSLGLTTRVFTNEYGRLELSMLPTPPSIDPRTFVRQIASRRARRAGDRRNRPARQCRVRWWRAGPRAAPHPAVRGTRRRVHLPARHLAGRRLGTDDAARRARRAPDRAGRRAGERAGDRGAGRGSQLPRQRSAAGAPHGHGARRRWRVGERRRGRRWERRGRQVSQPRTRSQGCGSGTTRRSTSSTPCR